MKLVRMGICDGILDVEVFLRDFDLVDVLKPRITPDVHLLAA